MFVDSRLPGAKAPAQSMKLIGIKSFACVQTALEVEQGQQDHLPVYSSCKSFHRVNHTFLISTLSKFASDLAHKLVQNVRGLLHNVHLAHRLGQVDSWLKTKEERRQKTKMPQLQPNWRGPNVV